VSENPVNYLINTKGTSLLTPQEISHYKSLLENRRASIAAQLESDAESSGAVELDQQRVGRLSRMDALQQQQMALALRRRLETDLIRIAAALDRIEAGTYGTCAKCDKPIARERLEAAPERPLCVACQPAPKR
jgi:DnaK suppressor protein